MECISVHHCIVTFQGPVAFLERWSILGLHCIVPWMGLTTSRLVASYTGLNFEPKRLDEGACIILPCYLEKWNRSRPIHVSPLSKHSCIYAGILPRPLYSIGHNTMTLLLHPSTFHTAPSCLSSHLLPSFPPSSLLPNSPLPFLPAPFFPSLPTSCLIWSALI